MKKLILATVTSIVLALSTLALTPASADAATYRNCRTAKIQVSVDGKLVYRTPGKCWVSRTPVKWPVTYPAPQ